ncbi:hypothetical protein ACK8P5_00905 [Paenibacillus sp. EC2-1]|uniref:hypothetical protein n=1 Tax=Paenibacillus sp. EC2-1 TaxID=3388665 RepID=UPI003BEF26D1
MAESRTKLLYFGKRDDAIWEAIQSLPKGDQNYHMKEALRSYFLSISGVTTSAKVTIIHNEAIPDPVEEDCTEQINIGKLSGLMIR